MAVCEKGLHNLNLAVYFKSTLENDKNKNKT